MTPPHAQCPGCDAHGILGAPCGERGCRKRGYHFIPSQAWERAHASQAQPDPNLGQRLADFLLIEQIGQGGFGKVYHALQAPLFKLDGALKLLDFDPADPLAPAMLDKFRGEAEALAALNHPNIVRLLKYGDHHKRPFLVMEFIAGGRTLHDEVWRRRKHKRAVDLPFVRHILSQILDGLEAAHACDIIHRDIKPDNVMLQDVAGNAHHVRLLDFGMAKVLQGRDTTQLPMGTPQYMAPEQITLRNLGPWTDLYAVGVMAFWMLTGLRPFPGDEHQVVLGHKMDRSFDPLQALALDQIPAPMIRFLRGAMAHAPEDRLRDVASFRAAMHAALDALGAAPPAPAPAPVARAQLAQMGQLDAIEALEDFEEHSSVEVLESVHILFSTLAPLEPSDAPTGHMGPAHKRARADARDTAPKLTTQRAPTRRARLAWLALVPLGIGALSLGAWITREAPTPPAPPEPTRDAPPTLAPEQIEAAYQRAQELRGAAAQSAEATARAHASASTSLDAARDALGAARVLADTPTGRIVQLAAAKYHTCALLDQGEVRCWGLNEGALGLTHRDNLGSDPRAPITDARAIVALGAPARAIATAGDRRASHSCAIIDLGDRDALRCWGDNKSGQLGLGHTDASGPEAGEVVLPDAPTQVAVSASQFGSHTCALTRAGRALCWGYNRYGQLGLGHTDTIGDDELPSVQVPIKAPLRAIAVGKYHSCAITRADALHCWGMNEVGQLGLGHTQHIGGPDAPVTDKNTLVPIKRVRAVAAGRQHTCALTYAGEVRCWGWNNKGQLGLGHTQHLGDDEVLTTSPSVELKATVRAIGAGDMHACALLEGGQLRCWGENQFGQLGLSHKRPVGDDELPWSQGFAPLDAPARALALGSYHTCVVQEDGGARCWGVNQFGQLGLGHTQHLGDDEAVTSAPPFSFTTPQ